MCSRFEVNSPAQKMIERFGLTVPPESFILRPEIRPTDTVLAIGPERKTAELSFGVPVDWDPKPLINARAETLTTKATFLPLLEQRCLIPASAYFEWQADDRGRKTKMRIALTDGAPFAMAALFKGMKFVIVTTAPAPDIAHIHSRMPLILPPDDEARWIDKGTPFSALTGVLKPSEQDLDAQPAAPAKTQPQGDLFG